MSGTVAAALAGFVPEGSAEASALDACLMLVSNGDPWSRTTPLHLTASAFILHPPSRRVLLRLHSRHGRWMQVGGHGDPGEVDPFAVARREAVEESGLEDLVGYPSAEAPELVQLVLVDVPESRGEPAHRHADLRYLLATATPEVARPEHPENPLRWCSLEEAGSLVEEENLRVFLARAGARLAAAT